MERDELRTSIVVVEFSLSFEIEASGGGGGGGGDSRPADAEAEVEAEMLGTKARVASKSMFARLRAGDDTGDSTLHVQRSHPTAAFAAHSKHSDGRVITPVTTRRRVARFRHRTFPAIVRLQRLYRGLHFSSPAILHKPEPIRPRHVGYQGRIPGIPVTQKVQLSHRYRRQPSRRSRHATQRSQTKRLVRRPTPTDGRETSEKVTRQAEAMLPQEQ